MPLVKFTKNLQRFFPDLRTINADGETVAEVVAALDQRYPGLAGYLLDDQGTLREHVNIFVNEELIQDRQTLTDALEANDQVYILQALSGG
ncbi:MAG: MoaD/ThiS family protein [Anaerolineales bacterium]|jgi:molybdopterin synthase sulfur carrier subunit